MSNFTSKQNFRSEDFLNLNIFNLGSLQLNADATSSDQAVRKSQAEAIAAAAVQAKLVSSTANASSDTAFTSLTVSQLLAAKQDNMSIHPDSTAYAQMINNQLRITRLTTNEVVVESSSTTLADCIGTSCIYGSSVWEVNGTPLERGDVLILDLATSAQERSWIRNANDFGDIRDFTRLQTDYDEAVIRAMISAGDSFIGYDSPSGQISLNLGTSLSQVGAQSLPVNSSEFSTVEGSTTLAVLKALESFIIQVDSSASGGQTTIDTRLTSLSGVVGNNLGSFSGLFSDSSTIKGVLSESEGMHAVSTQDRGLIRSQFAAADLVLQNALDAEVNRALGAEASEASARQSDVNSILSSLGQTNSNLVAETTRATSAEGILSGRLDIVEGEESQVGSIAHAVAESKSYTESKIALEAIARAQGYSSLDLKIDNLAEGDITFVGQILADGTLSIRQDRIAAGDTRNGQDFNNIGLFAGETFVAAADVTIAYTNGSSVDYEKGDTLMLVNDVIPGNLIEDKLNAVPANKTGLSVINIGSSTIEQDGNDHLAIIADSITRSELSPLVEADIDDKVSLTQTNAITSDGDTHFVVDPSVGAAQNMYWKRTSNTSDPLTGTKRALLAELYISSAGSGVPGVPSFAHTGTFSTHYQGTSVDMSMAVGGGNFEANVINQNAAVYATGVYATAQSQQLGINAAVTGVAQNAGISNIGITGFGKAGGIGKDRGGVFSLSDMDFLTYAGYRSLNPVSYPDVALLADAGTSATGKAFVAIGDSVFEGNVVVPNASSDNEAVNLADIKAKDGYATVNVPANSQATINHNKGTKIMVQLWIDGLEVTSAFNVRKTGSTVKIENDSSFNASNIEVCIYKLSVV